MSKLKLAWFAIIVIVLFVACEAEPLMETNEAVNLTHSTSTNPDSEFEAAVTAQRTDGEDDMPDPGKTPTDGEDDMPDPGKNPTDGEDDMPDPGKNPTDGEDDMPDPGKNPTDGEDDMPDPGKTPTDGEDDMPDPGN